MTISTVLENWNIRTELLALDERGQIRKIPKKSLTCWQVFLHAFGLGKFRHFEFDLEKVALHLNQYQWSRADPQLYYKVCELANRAFAYRGDPTLYKTVCANQPEVELRVSFTQMQNGVRVLQHTASHSLYWNPALSYRHLKTILQEEYNRYPSSISISSSNSLISSADELRSLKIDVVQYLPPIPQAPAPLYPIPRPYYPPA